MPDVEGPVIGSTLEGIEMHDTLMHTRSQDKDTDADPKEKLMFPVSRWEGVLGAPHVVTPETIGDRYPAEWCVMVTEELQIETQEFQAIFGDLVTV